MRAALFCMIKDFSVGQLVPVASLSFDWIGSNTTALCLLLGS